MRMVGVLWGGVFVVTLAGSILVVRGLDAGRGGPQLSENTPYVPSATLLRYASLGYRPMLADLMWIRATQYFGGELERRKALRKSGKFQESEDRYKFLFPLLDLTVSLDPQFIAAYRLGGLLLTVVKRYDDAIALYEKGYAANPDRWEMPHDLGRLYFLDLKDNEKALHWWGITNELPGRPKYIPRFVPRLYAKTGHREMAVKLWLELLQSTESDWFRGVIKKELKKLGVTVNE
ncbi:MAG: tetratricopeptide repeat protein [Candidatus Methylomirabilales bacterium]